MVTTVKTESGETLSVWPLDEEIAKAYEPYLHEIGRVVLAWTGLHETFADLFALLLEKNPPDPALAIWYAVKSDRMQREQLLRPLVNAVEFSHAIKAKKDLNWLLDRATDIENHRNNTIHTPLTYGVGARNPVQPSPFSKNPRAKELRAKGDLLNQFKVCSEYTGMLRHFAMQIYLRLGSLGMGPRLRTNVPLSWPTKPELPPLKPPKNQHP